MRVKKSDLGRLTPLAKGGFGEVFRAPDYRMPGDDTKLAYKEFTVDVDAQAQSAERAVAFRDRLSQPDRMDLDRHAVWPRALVEDNRKVVGLLMPLIPDDFFCKVADPATGGLTSKPREMQWLITTDQQRTAAQIDLPDVDATERLILLGLLVYAVGRLHRHGWVFGDLSFKNVVFALRPPRLILLDCDGAAALSDMSRKQTSTPMWDPPECSLVPAPGMPQQPRQDTRTDVYKLGLAMLRCIGPGKGAASSRNAGRIAGDLDSEGQALVGRAVSQDRDTRPTVRELYRYLRTTVATTIRPPAVLAARLATPTRVRGMDARIDWHISNVADVIVTAAGEDPVTVAVTGDPQTYTFTPRVSGPVFLEISNRYGELRVDLGDILLYELPEFRLDLADLPEVAVPPLPPVSLGAMRPALESVPRVLLPPVPPVPSLPATELVDAFTAAVLPAALVPAQLPRLAEAVGAAWRVVEAGLMDGARSAAQTRQYLASQPSMGGTQ